MFVKKNPLSTRHLVLHPCSFLASPTDRCTTVMQCGPCILIADWESLGLCVRVEIGSKDVAKKQFVLADLANKVKHENGRLIAKREFVTLEQLPERAKEVVAAVKAAAGGKEKRGTRLPEMQGTTLLDALRAITPQDIAAAGKKDGKKRKRSKSKVKGSEGGETPTAGATADAQAADTAAADTAAADNAEAGGGKAATTEGNSEKKKRKKRSKKKKKSTESEETEVAGSD